MFGVTIRTLLQFVSHGLAVAQMLWAWKPYRLAGQHWGVMHLLRYVAPIVLGKRLTSSLWALKRVTRIWSGIPLALLAGKNTDTRTQLPAVPMVSGCLLHAVGVLPDACNLGRRRQIRLSVRDRERPEPSGLVRFIPDKRVLCMACSQDLG